METLLLLALIVVVLFGVPYLTNRMGTTPGASHVQAPEVGSPRAASTVEISPWKIPPTHESFDRTIEVKSDSDPTARYLVNLHVRTCTCPDFTERREHRDRNSVERLCKHLARILQANVRAIGFSQAARQIIKQLSDGFRAEYYLVVPTSMGPAVISHSSHSPWFAVFLDYDERENGAHFSFNRDEERWSYGEEPCNADEIADFISRFHQVAA